MADIHKLHGHNTPAELLQETLDLVEADPEDVDIAIIILKKKGSVYVCTTGGECTTRIGMCHYASGVIYDSMKE